MQLNSNIILSHKYRFKSTAAFNGTITDSLLFGVVGAISATNIAAYSIAQSVKLNSVEMWAPVSAQGAEVDLSLEWPNQGQNPAKEITDSSNSVSRVAHIKTRPPKQSLAGFWTTGTGNTLFLLNIPIGTIIDVEISMVLGDQLTAQTHQLVTVGATVGAFQYGYLDSLTDAGALLKPVGLTPAP